MRRMSSSTPTSAPAEAPPWPPPSGSTASTYASPASSSRSSSSSSAAPATSPDPPSCAACKHQRRRCTADCILAPYFPRTQPDKFENARRMFGVKNMLRILRAAGPANRDVCMRTILYESEVQRREPVHGCRGVIRDLENRLRSISIDLATLQQQLALQRQTATGLHPPPAANNDPRGASSSTETACSNDDVVRQQLLATSRRGTPHMQSSSPRETASNMLQLTSSTSHRPMRNGDDVTGDHDA